VVNYSELSTRQSVQFDCYTRELTLQRRRELKTHLLLGLIFSLSWISTQCADA